MATSSERNERIKRIKSLPNRIESAVAGLSEEQLDTPYRDGGWTVRQVVHHLADSHLNAYTRLRLALSENTPTVKPYDQEAWAKMPDYSLPLEPSLSILSALHFRWCVLWESLPESAFARDVFHPDNGRMTVDDLLQSYSNHGDTHCKQITDLRARRGW